MHKSQIVSIGIGKDWGNVVFTILVKQIKTRPGMELVTLDRYNSKE